jgi:hypothetical protein
VAIVEKSWFSDPRFTSPTPLTVGADGRVRGHIALFGTCHTAGNGKTCLQPPRSRSNYAYFHTHAILFPDGEELPVGALTVGGGHAGLGLSARGAIDHYDNVGSIVADVVAGEDSLGIWVAGAVTPGATDEQIRALRASAPSGDWRQINGSLELVACLAVVSPGFPVPRVRALRAAGAPEDCDECLLSLVAAGALAQSEEKAHASDVRPGQVLITEKGNFKVSSVTFSEDGQVRMQGTYEELGGPGSGPRPGGGSDPKVGSRMSYVDHAGTLHAGGTYAGKFGDQHGVKFGDDTHLVSKSQLRPDGKFAVAEPLTAALERYESENNVSEETLAAKEDPNDKAVDADLEKVADDVDQTKNDQAKDDAEEMSTRLTALESAFTALANRVYSQRNV